MHSRNPPRPHVVACLDWLRWFIVASLVAATAGCAGGNQLSTRSFDELRAALTARDYARAERLVESNPADLDFARALDMAIRLGDADAAARFLPRAGADARLDPDHTTPLIRAIVDAPPTAKQKLVKLLLDAGADPGLADRYGRDPRDYAVTRAEFTLARMLGAPGAIAQQTSGKSAIERWLPPATLTAAKSPPPQARSRSKQPARGSAAAARAAAARARAAADSAAKPLRLSETAFLRNSPWVPKSAPNPRDGVAAFRFHADGTADVLRHRPGSSRFEPMPATYAAWRLERGQLRIAVVGRQLSALCVGDGARGDEIALSCADYDDEPASRGAALRIDGLDGARVVLTGAAGGLDASDEETVRTVIRPHGGASCKPSANRPDDPKPASDTRLGDWHVLDTSRFEVHAPLSGRACVQTEARQAALSACGAVSKSCLPLGGCPAGQVSAVAALPGVDSGWLACGAGYDEARSKALEACRADLGCDCQLVAIFGQNVNTSRDPICRARL